MGAVLCDVTKGTVSVAQYVSNVKKLEKKAISCTALHFEREETEVSDLKTDLEAFKPEVYRAMSDHNGGRQRQKTTTVEAKKDTTVLTTAGRD